MADSSLFDPLGRKVVLSDRTQDRHILVAHPDMEGGREFVEQAVRSQLSIWRHVVLDTILREELGLEPTDYETFAGHCRKIAAILGVSPVDVESGLFAYVQIANPKQRSRYWKAHQLNQ